MTPRSSESQFNRTTDSLKVKGAAGELVWNLAVDLLKDVPPGRLLEVAAGGGFLAALLVKLGFEVTGSDLANQWRFPEIPFVLADLDESLPFENESFDAVVFSEGLGYVENITAVLRELQRVLKPGGALVITMPNVFSLQSRLKFLFNGTFRWFPHPPYSGESKAELADVYRDPTRLTTLTFNLQRSGFDIERVQFGGERVLRTLAPVSWGLHSLALIENRFRKKKRTPTFVNSFAALHSANVGVLARKAEARNEANE